MRMSGENKLHADIGKHVTDISGTHILVVRTCKKSDCLAEFE